MNEIRNIKFSVVITLYNNEQFIAECIESIINQSYEPYEIIIINDGSTDGSQAIASSYVLKYPELVRLYNQKNQGAFVSRTKGLKLIQGDYFLFVDSDDYLRRDALWILHEKICKTDADLIIFNLSRSERFDVGMNDYSSWISEENFSLEEYRRSLCRESIFNSMCIKCTRRLCIEGQSMDSIGDGLITGEDKIHSLLVADYVNTVVLISDSLYFYRLNFNNKLSYFTTGFYDAIKRMLLITEKFAKKWFDGKEARTLLVGYKLHMAYYCASTAMHNNSKWSDIKQALNILIADEYWQDAIKEVHNIKEDDIGSRDRFLLKSLTDKKFIRVYLYCVLLKVKSKLICLKGRINRYWWSSIRTK